MNHESLLLTICQVIAANLGKLNENTYPKQMFIRIIKEKSLTSFKY